MYFQFLNFGKNKESDDGEGCDLKPFIATFIRSRTQPRVHMENILFEKFNSCLS